MFSPAGFGQTIAVVDQSGKIVSNGKHLLNIFRDVKSAYRERKAEITGQQPPGRRPSISRSYTFDDVRSTGSSRRSHSHRHHHRSHTHAERDGESRRHSRPSATHYYSDDRVRRHSLAPIDTSYYPPQNPYGEQYPPYSAPGPANASSPYRSPYAEEYHQQPPDLIRRHTTPYEAEPSQRGHPPSEYDDAKTLVGPQPHLTRSLSATAVDMDLAYGEPPHDLWATASPRGMPTSPQARAALLTTLVSRTKGLLVEADCLQHGVTTTLTKLQKNPDALAAVALTLAEISKLAKKLGPGALVSVRRTAPAVFALLSSPTFLVAVGLGVGVTVVALGGYKIIRKLQEQKALEAGGMARGGRAALEEGDDRGMMMALPAEVSSIENWRQGIAEIESQSVGTSVEGEFITPAAANLSRLTLHDAQGPAAAAGPAYSPGLQRRSTAHGRYGEAELIPVVSRSKSVRPAESRDGSERSTASTRREGRRSGAGDRERKRDGKDRKSTAGGGSKGKKKSSPLRSLFSP